MKISLQRKPTTGWYKSPRVSNKPQMKSAKPEGRNRVSKKSASKALRHAVIATSLGGFTEQGSIISIRLNDYYELPSRSFSAETFFVPEPKPVPRAIEQRFNRLAYQWKQETFHLSSMTKMVIHPAYQSIIGMGSAVLPLLFKELRNDPDHWFWALRAITEEDPTHPEDAGNLQKMSNSWLKWSSENGY
jgi:hypothetical protein